MQSRYYNPDGGRFVNADSIAANTGELLSGNMFAYSKNNPVDMADEDGDRPSFIGETAGDVETSVAATSRMLRAVSKNEPPPREVGYVPPKGKEKVVPTKAPNGQKGYPNSSGNVWVPIPEGHSLAHGGEHWDVNYPNGGYDNVYTDGHVRKGSGPRGLFSPEGKRIETDTEIAGGSILILYGAYRTVRMIPSFAPPLWWTIPANIAVP